MTEKHFIGNAPQKTYTQEELNDAVNQARCEGYERAKAETVRIRAKYNNLQGILRNLALLFDDGDP